MSAARFRRIHERQVLGMLYRAAWGRHRCIVLSPAWLAVS